MKAVDLQRPTLTQQDAALALAAELDGIDPDEYLRVVDLTKRAAATIRALADRIETLEGDIQELASNVSH